MYFLLVMVFDRIVSRKQQRFSCGFFPELRSGRGREAESEERLFPNEP